MVKIFYNDIDVFSGIAPTPIIGREQDLLEFGSRWGQKDIYNLEGQLTGQCLTFLEIINKQNELISRFNQDFKSFQIYENNELIVNKPYSRISNINFGDSNYVGVIPFSISIEAYDEIYFTGTYGIVNPEDSFSFEETSDGLLDITHVVSAKGFNTSNQALNNAKNWVLSRTGFNGQVYPEFIKYCYDFEPCLITFRETINRLTAEYSIEEDYIVDLKNSGYGVLRYTVDIESGVEQNTIITRIQGNISSCKNSTIQDLRDRYYDFNIFSEAFNVYNKATNRTDLNPIPINSGVVENPFSKNLSFTVEFDNDSSPLVINDYTLSISHDTIKNKAEVSIASNIRGKGNLKNKWENVRDYFNNNFFPYNLANGYYKTNGFTGNLNPLPISESIKRSEFNAQINYDATWTDKLDVVSGFVDLSYSINIIPAVTQYDARPTLFENGIYSVYDLGYLNRESMSINGEGLLDENTSFESGILIIKNFLESKRLKYFPGNWDVNRQVLSEVDVATGDPNKISFNYTWSREAPELVLV